jgi:Protein of unknown function (DUF429)
VSVYGVDFSGAVDAGKRIWIAEAVPCDGVLSVRALDPAYKLPGSAVGRRPALCALRRLIGARPAAVVGIDVPFGLPAALVGQASWLDFLRWFVGRYPDADGFKSACLDAANGKELKRATDRSARTPFSAYNLRLYRQTFFALDEVIGPLVLAQEAVAAPMQPRTAGRTTLVEVCPASTLKAHGRYVPYKRPEHRPGRVRIVEWLARTTPMAIPAELYSVAVADANGDAVDALVAVAASWRASRAGPSTASLHRLEGFVYL